MIFSKKLITFLPFIFVFLLFFLAPIDTDLGWHLRYGEKLVTTGKLMRANELTFYLTNYRWSHSYTLYQALTYLVYQLGGLLLLTFSTSLLMTLAFWFFRKAFPKLPLVSFFLFALISWFGWIVFHLGFRSQLFTFVGMIVVFLLLKLINKHPKAYLAFPLLFFVWANFHGGFVLGLALLGFGIFDKLIKKDLTSFYLLSFSLIASLLATLINPFGLGIYQEAVKHWQVPLGKLIAEWVPPTISFKILIATMALILLAFLFSSSNKSKLFWALSVATFAFLAFQSRRNLPLFGLVAAIGVLDVFQKDFSRLEKNKYFQKFSLHFLVFGIAYLLLTTVPKNFQLATNWSAYCHEKKVVYPCKAIEFIKRQKIPGQHVFSAYEWGGFLEWQLPEYQFFVDGRMPAWPTPEGKSPYTVYLEIIQAQPGYQERLDRFQVDWLLIANGTFLDLELSQKENPYWKEFYRDPVAVIYIRER